MEMLKSRATQIATLTNLRVLQHSGHLTNHVAKTLPEDHLRILRWPSAESDDHKQNVAI